MDFFFAYVANGSVAFNAGVHNTRDERVYGIDFNHVEGGVATLTLLLKNPKIGLLNASRFQWLWFSYQDGGAVTPLFLGRLEGLPSDLQNETLTLVYRAEPIDFESRKEDLAETLRVFPYFDPIWFDPDKRGDPENVLEARSARWHVDPITHEVTISDIIVGEGGTVGIDVDEQYYPTLKFGYGGVPITRLHVQATVDWEQRARGAVNLKPSLQKAFQVVGSTEGLLTSFTGSGLQKTWPQTGDRIGGGWAFGLSVAGEPSGASTRPPEDEKREPSQRYRSLDYRFASDPLPLVPNQGDEPDGITVVVQNGTEANPSELEVFFSRWKFNPPYFDVAYNADRKRKEILTFDLVADIQTITLGAERTETFTISSSNVMEEIDDELPLGKMHARRYFDTERGKHSLDWLIALARARLLFAARAVNLSCQVPWSKFLEMTLRKNALLVDNRLPGGTAGGKIVGYGFQLSGGVLTCSVEIAGTIGLGNELPEPNSGSPTHVEEGHYALGYQKYSGAQIVAIEDGVLYDDFEADIEDDNIDFADMRPETIIEGSRAEATFRLGQLPLAAQTVTIAGTTYTWKAAADVPNSVRIGYTTDDSMINLICAILALENLAGTRYGEGTVKNPNVTARLGLSPNTMIVIAEVPGTAANALTVSTTGVGASWSSATLLGGAAKPAGLRVVGGDAVQTAVLEEVYSDVEAVEKALNDVHTVVKMELVNLVGGPFETTYELGDLDLMVQKTVDLEADAA